MIQNELDIRLKPAIESTSSTKVPLDGEVVFVKDTNNTANNNIRIGNGEDAIASLSNFLTLSSGGGATYQTTLNGTLYGDSGGTPLGSWYAPTTAGSQYALLTSSGSGAPSWTLPTLASGQTTGLLKYTSGSGWLLHNFPTFYATNSVGTSSWATDLQDITFTSGTGINLGIATGNLTINVVGAPRNTNGIGGINVGTEVNPSTITEATSGAYYAVQTNSSNKAFVRVPSSGSFPNIGQGLYLNTSTNTLQLNLPVYPLGYATSDLGGIRTVGGIVSSGGYDVASSGTYYPVQTDNSGVAMVKVPSGGGSYTAASTASGANNPGLLKVVTDQNCTYGFLNETYIDAIPIFYGTISHLKTYSAGDESEPYSKGDYENSGNFTGHYVNVHDVVNGLIKNQALMQFLANNLKPYLGM